MYRVGTAVRDITPPLGYRMQGHDARRGLSEKVHDPLNVKVLSIGDGVRRIVVVTSDLIYFQPALAAKIKQSAWLELGLKPEQFLLASAHVHTGPFLFVGKAGDERHFVPGYLETLSGAILEALREAAASEEPATLSWGRGESDIGVINRRLQTSFGVEMRPNPAGPIDKDVLVLAARGADSHIRALLFNYACHPTTVDTEIAQISADYPGAAQRALEARYPGAVALFMNGCCGDVRPNLVANGNFRGGSFEDVDRMGNALAGAVASAVESAERVPDGPVQGRLETLELPLDEALLPATPERLDQAAAHHLRRPKRDESVSGAWYTPSDEPAVAAWKSEMAQRLKRGEKPATCIPMAMQALAIGPVKLLGMGGELMVEIGQRIKGACPRTMVGSYANGVVGYIPTAAALTEGGYEAKSFLYRNYPAPYADSMEDLVVERALAMLRKYQ